MFSQRQLDLKPSAKMNIFYFHLFGKVLQNIKMKGKVVAKDVLDMLYITLYSVDWAVPISSLCFILRSFCQPFRVTIFVIVRYFLRSSPL